MLVVFDQSKTGSLVVNRVNDFAIVGAGVIGMMLARELAQAGATVALIDKGECARESSWAGGGIVSPLYPWRYSTPVTQLATWSQSSYLHLSQDLLEETGLDPELRQRGMYMVAVDDEEDALQWAQQHHRPMMRVDAQHLYNREPNFAPGHTSALWMPEVSSIRNPRLGAALKQSVVLNPNITAHEHSEVTGLLSDGQRVLGVKTPRVEIKAAHTIVTSGAWTGELLKRFDVSLPVEPVKGQMMVFNAPVGLVNRVVLMGGRYVIPRNDGRILVGSTLEYEGFDKQTTDVAFTSLRDTAIGIIPELANYDVEHHWAGLRPGSPEGIPFIGEVPEWQGLSVNAGHFRNGLVLAPASTRLHADLLLGRDPVIDPQPYQLAGRMS